MGRPRKGARLYLRAGRIDRKTRRPLAPVYFIRDGQKNISTGFGPDSLEQAEQALAAYLASKVAPVLSESATPPSAVLVAEVIELYARERAPDTADPISVKVRLQTILDWWGDKTLAQVTRSACKAYVAWRTSQPIKSFKDPKTARRVSAVAAGRELEDLSAAIGWWDGEHPLTRLPVMTMPKKVESPRDALSRSQAAALLLAARGRVRGPTGRWLKAAPSTRSNRAHLARFVLLGIYSGTRPGLLPRLRWSVSDTDPWVDLERGWIFRRGRGECESRTKQRPLIRIPRRLLGHLKRWKVRDDRENLARTSRGQPPIETVLHHGGRAISGRIRTGYAGIVKAAGLDDAITPHWHRHTCATWLMEEDVPAARAAQYLGMTIATLEKHYGHHRPDHQNDVGSALARGGRRT